MKLIVWTDGFFKNEMIKILMPEKLRGVGKVLRMVKPVIQKAMAQHDVTRQFDAVVVNIRKLPFVKADVPDVEEYVLGKSLGGLFLMIGEQEKKIRKDPAAQETARLREVLGKRQDYLINSAAPIIGACPQLKLSKIITKCSNLAPMLKHR